MSDEYRPEEVDGGGGTPAAAHSEGVSDEAIQLELQRVSEEMKKLQELYLRKLADFDNYRKRQEREMEEFRRHAASGVVRDSLPVLDNLERALAAPGGSDQSLREGVELVLRQLRDVLVKNGLEEVDPGGQAFDPSLHEAILRQESADVSENTVVDVYQKGYTLNGRLLRPALVVVAVPAAERRALPEEDEGA